MSLSLRGGQQDRKFWSIAIGALFVALTAGAISSDYEREFDSSLRRQRESSSLICQINSFLTTDRQAPQINRFKFEGRALLTCQNTGGFMTELPLLVDLQAVSPSLLKNPPSEIGLTGVSTSFVIPQDVRQIQDTYRFQSLSGHPNGTRPKVILRGLKHDLVIELELNSQVASIDDLKIESLRLRFDEQAPTLKVDIK